MVGSTGSSYETSSYSRARAAQRSDWNPDDYQIESWRGWRSPTWKPKKQPDDRRHHDDEEEEQFVLSVANTPATESAPRLTTRTASRRRAAHAESRSSTDMSRSFDNFSDGVAPDVVLPPTSSGSANVERSMPITIEMPSSGRPVKADHSASTPSAPLSARGDLPGGYFPRHEDPDTRVHRPHPFHEDTKEARRQSIAKATEDSTSPVSVPASGGSAGRRDSPTIADPCTKDGPGAVMSYNPTGAHDNMLPMGKYYPTNWEARKKQKKLLKDQQTAMELKTRERSLSRRPAEQEKQEQKRPQKSPSLHRERQRSISPAGATSTHVENPSVTRAKAPLSHSRSDSEAKRRLQQYQRDMITQASLAASQALGGAIKQRGSDSVMQSLNRVPTLRSLNLSPGSSSSASSGLSPPSATGAPVIAPTSAAGSHFNHRFMLHRPTSPRLQPLGSPGGLVTPMDLGEDAAGYLAAGGSSRPRMPQSFLSAPPAPQMRPQPQESFPF